MFSQRVPFCVSLTSTLAFGLLDRGDCSNLGKVIPEMRSLLDLSLPREIESVLWWLIGRMRWASLQELGFGLSRQYMV